MRRDLRPAGLDLIALSHLAEQGTPIGGNLGLVRGFEKRAGVKMAEIEKNPETYQYSSLLTEIAKVRCPVLMISGKNDPHGPLPVMDQYVDALAQPERRPKRITPTTDLMGSTGGFPR